MQADPVGTEEDDEDYDEDEDASNSWDGEVDETPVSEPKPSTTASLVDTWAAKAAAEADAAAKARREAEATAAAKKKAVEAVKKPSGLQKGFLAAAPARATNGAAPFAARFMPLNADLRQGDM